MNSCALAVKAALSTSSWVAFPRPRDMFSRAVFENKKLSSKARLTLLLNSFSFRSLILTPSISIDPDSIS